MDPPKKRIKLTNSSVIEIFTACSDNILQHLSGADLMNLSLVSKRFNHIVEISDITSQKLAFVIKENPRKLFKVEDLSSTRFYTHLKIRKLVDPSNPREISFLIHKLSYSLEHIETCYDIPLPKTFHLPVLSTLIMILNYQTKLHFNGLLDRADGLTTLHIIGKTSRPYYIIDCLDANPNLAELILENGASEIVFRFIGADPPLKLRTLKLDNVNFTGKVEQNNFLNLISENKDSLTEVKLLRCEMKLLNIVLQTLKRLVKLTYNQPIYEVDGSREHFQVHLRIRELNLIMVGTKDTKKLMSVAPNARKIYIAEATLEIFQYVILNLPALREFHYAYFKDLPGSVGYIRNLYQEVIKKWQRCNRNISFHQI